MNILKELALIHGTQADARAGHVSVEERLTATLGVRPHFDPIGNTEHGEIARVLANGAAGEELREDLARAEDELAKCPSPALCTVGIVVALIFEIVGSTMVMSAFDLLPVERVLLGVALAFGMVLFTAGIAHRAAAKVPVLGTLGVRVVQVAKRSALTFVVIGAYALLVFAVAVVRIQTALNEDTSLIVALGEALIMIATTLGPAWTVEWLVRLRRPGSLIHEQAKVLRRRLQKAVQSRNKARTSVDRIARAGTKWDADAAKLRALYQVHHRLESAKERDRVHEASNAAEADARLAIATVGGQRTTNQTRLRQKKGINHDE